ncbi:hypothetical protein LB507_009088, partial [Fusarium sp. FIESC RH6]
MLPCTIRVEEVSYFEDDPYGILVHDQGMFYAQSLYSFENEAVPEHTQTGDGPAQETSQEVHMNFGAHRAGVISANDPRTVEMLRNETPAFYGDKRKLSGVKVFTREQLAEKLKALRSNEAMMDPENGRVIVFSIYPALSARWLATDREPFGRSEDVETPTKTSDRTKEQRIRSYTKETIDTGKIAKIPKGDTREGCDGELIEYRLSKPAVEKFEFDMLIGDEAQFMRRASGSYSNRVRLIKWEKLLFVTGTPMASSLKDVLSPLTLIRHIDPRILAFQGLCQPPV